jgi:AAA domain
MTTYPTHLTIDLISTAQSSRDGTGRPGVETRRDFGDRGAGGHPGNPGQRCSPGRQEHSDQLAANRQAGAVIRLLDDPATLQATKDDPTGFVDHPGLMVIDEIQLAPKLLRPIKVAVDLDPTPGRFLLTGSSRILALRTLPDALPGRMEIIRAMAVLAG